MRADTYIFLGPTLPVAEAEQILPATYLPPVAQGDVLRLLRKGPTVIGIIDGYFERVPAVWHKEILLALEQGVAVFGAASMGALRAAELHAFGMVGIGEIFEQYLRGELEDDDEVTLIHGPAEAGYRAQSEAMVNLRYLFAAAVRQGVVDARDAEVLTRTAKALYYPDRNLARVLVEGQAAGLAAEPLTALARFAATCGPSLKARDAMQLLRTIAARPAPEAACAPRVTVERTVFLDTLELEVRESEAGPISAHDPLAGLAGEAPGQLERDLALLGVLAHRELERFGLGLGVHEKRAAVEAFRQRFGLRETAQLDAGLDAAHLTLESFVARILDLTAIERVRAIHAIECARAQGEHAALIRLARATDPRVGGSDS